MYTWNPQGFPSYVPDSADDAFLRPILPSPRASPTPSPRASPRGVPMYLDENYGYAQPGQQYIGVPMISTAFVPLPPSPTSFAAAAAYAPLPPSPRVSPRLGSIPLAPQAPYMPQQYAYPFDPYYFAQANAASPYTSSRTRVHPLLADSMYAHLDLSSHTYAPQTPGNNNSSSLRTLHPGYLVLPASYPVVTHLTLRCSAFKKFEDSWKITMDLRRSISVGDVLRAVYDAMQTRVTHEEWARMSDREVYEASHAYTRRSRTSDFEKMQGVRRVDFLGNKHYFGGMQVVREDDAHHFKLLVKAK